MDFVQGQSSSIGSKIRDFAKWEYPNDYKMQEYIYNNYQHIDIWEAFLIQAQSQNPCDNIRMIILCKSIYIINPSNKKRITLKTESSTSYSLRAFRIVKTHNQICIWLLKTY